jgi:hypothetical protein
MTETDNMVEREIGRWTMERLAVERGFDHERDLPAALITVSRQLGAGGGEFASRLSARIGCPIYGRELVDEIVRQFHVCRNLVDDIDEHAPGKVESWLESIITHEIFDCEDYRCALVEVLDKLAAQGPAIVLGRGANFLPRVHPRLDVRVTAPIEARVARLMNRQGLTEAQALAAIRRSDHERREFTRRAYGGNWDDPSRYDLVINTGRLSFDEAVDLTETMWNDLHKHTHASLACG